ncbi:putative immunity protein [Methanocorpusculum bavaricum]|uniref:putative immunity protein n=1 Tax=Methanocorpusculum bavaricum TaxID=71518 RepID=UPI0012DCA73A|nr:hypothetical protein [Methanocorpusculum bavaricum]
MKINNIHPIYRDEIYNDVSLIFSHQKILAVWALDCAERVLSIFEEKYPNDPRPREALEAGRAWVRGEIKVGEARIAAFSSHAAARAAAGDPPASFAARAVGHAAATSHTSGHAIHAAEYAVKAVFPEQREEERAWQYRHLLSLTRQPDTAGGDPDPDIA